MLINGAWGFLRSHTLGFDAYKIKGFDMHRYLFDTRTRPFVVLGKLFVQNTKQINTYGSNSDLNVDSLCL